jgi:hypothetical protein
MAICLFGVEELWLDRQQLGFEPRVARLPGGEECEALPIFRLNPAVPLRSDGNHGKFQPVLGVLRKIQFVPQREYRVLLLERTTSVCNLRKYRSFTEILTRHTQKIGGSNNVRLTVSLSMSFRL